MVRKIIEIKPKSLEERVNCSVKKPYFFANEKGRKISVNFPSKKKMMPFIKHIEKRQKEGKAEFLEHGKLKVYKLKCKRRK